MRPFRLLLSIFTCVILLTLLLYANFPAEASQAKAAPAPPPQKKKGKLGALFSWTAPSSLFPPSAIISLTDDNSTFFLARPAAFGPLLPARGLSGPLWVGSGFSDDALNHGSGVAGLDGELGCSDVPGWSDGNPQPAGRTQIGIDTRRKGLADNSGNTASSKQRRRLRRSGSDDEVGPVDGYETVSPPALDQNDGTDDYLHHPLGDSDALKAPQKLPEHADIQSLQEGAEIAGKVVLLSRGGCGFLEKVKWAQRRGATALIVGDNIRGGALITMYAHGDTSNITIPAIFTSHTTAHLLSSLMPSGGAFKNLPPGDSIKLGGPAGKKTESGGKSKEAPKQDTADSPVRTNPNLKSTQSSTSRPMGKGPQSPPSSPKKDTPKVKQSPGLFKSLLSLLGLGGDNTRPGTDSRRPPSSGGLDWVLVEDFVDDRAKKTSPLSKSTQVPDKQVKQNPSNPDDFVIGVQDWRDPDLLPQQTGIPQNKLTDKKEKPEDSNGQLKGGSILPGSGEYAKPASDVVEAGSASSSASDGRYDSTDENGRNRGWLSALQWGHDDDGAESDSSKRHVDVTEHPNMSRSDKVRGKEEAEPLPNNPEHHEGLWVTLTPTNMSSSPFFDTLLVLVVSPLVTLTVVYALLLLRSRIRRRRWRAPKSVVDRLPVRTYHTLPSDSSSPTTTPVTTSPTTPLLSQHRPRSPTSRSRPRSHTTPEVPAQTSSSYQSRHRHGARSPSPEAEKREAGLAEWRRRYGGRQKECVVCLEEYVDGVSRVMSLPCGHEFHAECITPWLTTRRRTCPICKGDVVRSLQRHSASSSNPNSFSSTRPHGPSRSPSSSTLSSSASSTHSTSPARRSATSAAAAAAASPPHPDIGLGLAMASFEEEQASDLSEDGEVRAAVRGAVRDAVRDAVRGAGVDVGAGIGIGEESEDDEDADAVLDGDEGEGVGEYDVEIAERRRRVGGGVGRGGVGSAGAELSASVGAALEGVWRRVRDVVGEVGEGVGTWTAGGRARGRGRAREEDFDRDR